MSKLIHLVLVKISYSADMLSPLLVTFVNYFILGMGDQSFRFDGTLWLPWDSNEPIGFFLTLLFQGAFVLSIFYYLTPIVGVYIGSCWSIITFMKDISKNILHLKKRKILNMSTQMLCERFCNFVRFHADVVEFSKHPIVML